MTKYYVTTSLPYVNAEPHIGFAMELLQADVLARRARAQGREVMFSTGTDEHGGKVAAKAAEAGQSPQQYTDHLSLQFRELSSLLDVSNNRFIRTTDTGHEQRVQLIWRALKDFIYKAEYSGWYCTGCEAFIPEAQAKELDNKCPDHERRLEQLKEQNYFFKLSQFGNRILTALNEGDMRITPLSRQHEIEALLKGGLDDISISRPVSKLSWGVPVPGDKGQVIYVWFEALMNYITVLGYPENKDFANFWPADVQVIGKDILRFHAAIWPAILLALNLPLPKCLLVHGFVTVDGRKMSKSIGNVVQPRTIIERYGQDACRYYFLRHIPAQGDGDFSWQRLATVYNNELANELGNVVQRTAAMISRYQRGVVGIVPPPEHDVAPYDEALKQFRFDKALEIVWQQVRGLNQYIEEEKPWLIAALPDPDHLREVLAYQVSCLLEIADLLEPFVPRAAAQIKTIFSAAVIKSPATPMFPKTQNGSSAATA